MAYESVHLENSITIENIISVHYFQYMSDFSFCLLYTSDAADD